MNIEVGKEVPHADYCGFLYAEENISSSSEELFEDSNETTEPMQSNEIKLYDGNSTSEETADLGPLDWSGSEISSELSNNALINSIDYHPDEETKYPERSSEDLPRLRPGRSSGFIKTEKIFTNDREKELLHKMLIQNSDSLIQTENPGKNRFETCVFLRAIIVVFMIVMGAIVIKDYNASIGVSIVKYCSKCCLCVFLSSTVKYISTLVSR